MVPANAAPSTAAGATMMLSTGRMGGGVWRRAGDMPSVRRPRLTREPRMFSWLLHPRDGDRLVRTHLLRVARDDEVARPQPRRDNDSVSLISRNRDRPCRYCARGGVHYPRTWPPRNRRQ